jgi:hypothetical protein
MIRQILLACVLSVGLNLSALAENITLYAKPLEIIPKSYAGLELVSITELTSSNGDFGGLSGLLMKEGRLLAVSDKGKFFRFDLKDLSKAQMFPLREKNGDPLEGKKNSDAESLALGPKGEILIAFERDHRIVLYDEAGNVIAKKLKLPKAVSELPKNSGLEAIETLDDGTLVLISEGKKDAASTSLWIKSAKGKWIEKSLSLKDGFRPTGLTHVAGRDFPILMERFYEPFQGVRIRLSWLDVDKAERISQIAEFTSPPMALDNMEGITSYKNDAGEDILLLISDDNFNPLQRTLLMSARLK